MPVILNLEDKILSLIRGERYKWFTTGVNLGGVTGVSGGTGGPLGGFIGQLTQSKVTYDTSENEIWDVPVSGESLVTNLDRIRYRLTTIDHGNLQGLDTGADHSYIDQDVQVAATPTFTGLTLEGNQIIDATSTEALLVRKNADGGDVFVVDTTNGRVGIGTSSPYSGLHYQGDILYLTPAAGAESNDNITIKNYATGNGAPNIILRTADIDGAYGIGVGTLSLIGGSKTTHYGGIGGGGGKISLQGGQGRDAANSPSSYAPILLQPNAGNVGIGTSDPNAPLEVKGAKPAGNVGGFQSGMLHVTGDGIVEFSNSVITGHNAYSGNTQLWYLGSVSGSNNDIAFINRQDGSLSLWTNSTGRLRITNDGNVGIGGITNYATFAADGELTLAGTARVTAQIPIDNANLGKGNTAPAQIIIGDYNSWEYDINDDTVFTFHLPHDWATGTDVTISIDWFIDQAYVTNSGEVKWQIVWAATPHDESEPLDGPTHMGFTDTGDINIPATAKTIREDGLTIAGASLSAEDQIGITISRIALTDGNNPSGNVDPAIVDIHIQYIADKLGEAT